MSVKKFYWLKLKEDFFTDPKIKKLRKIAGGDTYTIILQKIMLLSVKTNGILEFQGIEKTLHEELSLILDEDEDNIQVTLTFMLTNGIIEQISDNDFLLPKVVELIGSESDSKERVRRFREKQKLLPSVTCNGDVTECNDDGNKNVTTERRDKREEIRDKRKDIEKDFDFSLSRDTHYSNLSKEYKEKLKEAIEGLGLSISHDDFVEALEAKASYKYKNFLLTYKNWAKKDFNKSKKPSGVNMLNVNGKDFNDGKDEWRGAFN